MKAVLRLIAVAVIFIGAISALTGPSEPWNVSLKTGEESIRALTGSYFWRHRFLCFGGETKADGVHPLDAKDRLGVLASADGKIWISVMKRPDTVRVTCWSFDETMETADLDGTRLEVTDLAFTVPEGKWVINITLGWNGDRTGGNASYVAVIERAS